VYTSRVPSPRPASPRTASFRVLLAVYSPLNLTKPVAVGEQPPRLALLCEFWRATPRARPGALRPPSLLHVARHLTTSPLSVISSPAALDGQPQPATGDGHSPSIPAHVTPTVRSRSIFDFPNQAPSCLQGPFGVPSRVNRDVRRRLTMHLAIALTTYVPARRLRAWSPSRPFHTMSIGSNVNLPGPRQCSRSPLSQLLALTTACDVVRRVHAFVNYSAPVHDLARWHRASTRRRLRGFRRSGRGPVSVPSPDRGRARA